MLIDFGLCKHYDDHGTATSTVNTSGYSDGYSPVEQYSGITGFSPRSDIYALGATLLYCLSGVRPAKSSDITEADIRHQLGGCSAATADAVVSMMKMQAAERPGTVREAFSPLISNTATDEAENEEEVLTSEIISTRKISTPKRKRRLWLIIAMVMLAVAAGSAYALIPNNIEHLIVGNYNFKAYRVRPVTIIPTTSSSDPSNIIKVSLDYDTADNIKIDLVMLQPSNRKIDTDHRYDAITDGRFTDDNNGHETIRIHFPDSGRYYVLARVHSTDTVNTLKNISFKIKTRYPGRADIRNFKITYDFTKSENPAYFIADEFVVNHRNANSEIAEFEVKDLELKSFDNINKVYYDVPMTSVQAHSRIRLISEIESPTGLVIALCGQGVTRETKLMLIGNDNIYENDSVSSGEGYVLYSPDHLPADGRYSIVTELGSITSNNREFTLIVRNGERIKASAVRLTREENIPTLFRLGECRINRTEYETEIKNPDCIVRGNSIQRYQEGKFFRNSNSTSFANLIGDKPLQFTIIYPPGTDCDLAFIAEDSSEIYSGSTLQNNDETSDRTKTISIGNPYQGIYDLFVNINPGTDREEFPVKVIVKNSDKITVYSTTVINNRHGRQSTIKVDQIVVSNGRRLPVA